MTTRILILLALISGCSGTFGDTSKRSTLWHVNQIGTGAMLAMTACDAGSTYIAAHNGWHNLEEQGWPAQPIMGHRPDPSIVGAYFVVAAAVALAVEHSLPEQVKPFLWAPLLGVEGFAVYSNLAYVGPCGISTGRVR